MIKRFFSYVLILVMIAIGMTGCDISKYGCDVCLASETDYGWHGHAIGKGTVVMCERCNEKYYEICEFFEPVTSWFKED